MAEIGRRTTSIADLGPRSAAVSGVGRPKFEIAQELLENLRVLGCTWMQIVRMLQVSRWTIRRRVVEYGLPYGRWSDISDYQLDTDKSGFQKSVNRVLGADQCKVSLNLRHRQKHF